LCPPPMTITSYFFEPFATEAMVLEGDAFVNENWNRGQESDFSF
jgi:hypothetical protein